MTTLSVVHPREGQHGVPRPLPPPPLVHHTAGKADHWDEMLEQWMAECRVKNTQAGE